LGRSPESQSWSFPKRTLNSDSTRCEAEFTVVLLNDVERDTVAIESADPDELLRLIREVGFEGHQPNAWA
jgi:hypothetical protein